jgi:hypothetical protein
MLLVAHFLRLVSIIGHQLSIAKPNLFYSITNDVAHDDNATSLSNAQCSGHCLVFYAWIPLRFDNEDPIRRSEVKTLSWSV